MLSIVVACSWLSSGGVPNESPDSGEVFAPTGSSFDALASTPVSADKSDSVVSPSGETASPKIKIVDWFLPNEPLRKELTIEYLKLHSQGFQASGDLEKDSRMTPRVITLHWTAGSSSKSTYRYFSSATLSGRKRLQKAGSLNVAAHFLVDRDGTIYRLAEEERILRHVIGLNHVSIGVENVGDGKKWPMTEEQVAANIALVRYLTQKHPITHLIGHYEYRGMEKGDYFDEKDPRYRTRKSDPGPDFMKKVRHGVSDLNLLGVESR